MRTMTAAILISVISGACGLAGCVSTPADETPAWVSENQQGYPSLRDVPRTSDANTDAAHWAVVELEMLALGEAVKNHPRAQPVTTADGPSVFLEEAREDLEQARRAHEPN